MSGSPRALLPFHLAALAYALDYEHIVEVGGDNRGPAVEFFQRCAKLGVGTPWCAAFVNACAELAAAVKNEPSPLEEVELQGYVPSYYAHGRREGWRVPFEETGPGDLFLLYFPSKERHAHIGFVDAVDLNSDRYMTVEGNTDDRASREGIKVARRARSPQKGDVFLRWTA